MTNKKISIITSYYTDIHKLNWKDECKNYIDAGVELSFYIYKKNKSLVLDPNIQIVNESQDIEIPNIGRCDFAFLTHIVKNYDDLADINIFTKVNWADQSINFFGLVRDSQNYDFCDAGESAEIQIWEHDILDSDPEQYLVSLGIHTPFVQMIDSRKTKKSGYYHHPSKSDCIHDWYSHIFNDSTPPKNFWSWGQGPCFSVSRDLIRRHPKDVYEYLASRFLPASNSWDNDTGKRIMSEVRGYAASDNDVMLDAANHYYDNFTRFWRVLFTHDTDKEKFKIKIN